MIQGIATDASVSAKIPEPKARSAKPGCSTVLDPDTFSKCLPPTALWPVRQTDNNNNVEDDGAENSAGKTKKIDQAVAANADVGAENVEAEKPTEKTSFELEMDYFDAELKRMS